MSKQSENQWGTSNTERKRRAAEEHNSLYEYKKEQEKKRVIRPGVFTVPEGAKVVEG